MRIGARIRRIRLERSVTPEDLEAMTGLAKSLLTRLELGREVPTLAVLDTLAEALAVPVHIFFFDTAAQESTPRLTPRPALNELAEECGDPAASISLWNLTTPVIAAIKTRSRLPQRVRDRLSVRLRSPRASRQRDPGGDPSQGKLQRMRIEMKLLVASFFSWF